MNGDILLKFVDQAVLRHNEYWFSPVGAIEVIREAKTKCVPLLGFDGAEIKGDTIELFQSQCWDYGLQIVSDPYEHAIQFIAEQQEKSLRFTILLGEPE